MLESGKVRATVASWKTEEFFSIFAAKARFAAPVKNIPEKFFPTRYFSKRWGGKKDRIFKSFHRFYKDFRGTNFLKTSCDVKFCTMRSLKSFSVCDDVCVKSNFLTIRFRLTSRRRSIGNIL